MLLIEVARNWTILLDICSRSHYQLSSSRYHWWVLNNDVIRLCSASENS